jgi:hypothetical protein
MSYLTVVNRTNAQYSLAGILALPPAVPWRPVVVHVDGIHEAMRTQLLASVKASEKAQLIAILGRGTKAECEKAALMTEEEFMAKANEATAVVDMTTKAPEPIVTTNATPATVDAAIRSDSAGKAEPATTSPLISKTAEPQPAPAQNLVLPSNLGTVEAQKALLTGTSRPKK